MAAEIKGAGALRIGRLPIHFFVTAAIFFAGGCAATPFLVAQIVDFFYQPPWSTLSPSDGSRRRSWV
jgi:hypothetical protein